MHVYPDGEELALFDTDDLSDDGAFLVADRNGVLAKGVYFWVGDDSELKRCDTFFFDPWNKVLTFSLSANLRMTW